MALTEINRPDGEKSQFGTGDDLQIYHNGSHSFITNSTGDLVLGYSNVYIQPVSGENGLRSVANGTTELYYDAVKKFETTSSGVQLSGTSHQILGDFWFNNDTNGGKDLLWDESADSLIFYNSVKATFGGLLEIYSNGTNSWINNSSGALIISGNDLNFENAARDETYIECDNNGAVKLRYNNVTTFQTTSNGVIVTGGEGEYAYLYIYSDEGDDNADKWRWEVGNGGAHILSNMASGSWEKNIECNGNGNVELYYDGTKKVETNSTGVQVDTYITLGGTGGFRSDNAIVIEDIGGNEWRAKFHDNAQCEFAYDNIKKLETTSTGITVSGNVKIYDGNKILCGHGDDLEIYHDGDNSFIQNSTGEIRTNDTWRWDDSAKATFGYSNDLQLYHESGNSYIKNDTGVTYIRGNDIRLESVAGDRYIDCTEDSSVSLCYDDSKKLETGNDKVNFFAHIKANADNTYDIGASGARWSTIYSQNALNTSDKNLKNTIETSDLGLSFINKLNPVSYKFNQIEGQKQDTKTHYGLIAQEVEEVLGTQGKTTDDFAAVVEEDGVYNLAYNELISPLIKAVQELSAELNTLKTKIGELS